MIEFNAMETLQISPNILRWAADQRGLSLDALVDLLDKPAKHDCMCAGKFSIAEAEKLAKKTHIPFGYFFLDTPPVTVQRGIPDLRQLPNHEPLSIDLSDVLDDMLRKQQWYQEYLQEQAAEPKFEALSKTFKVSKLVIARRALDLGKIDWATYQTISDASAKQKLPEGSKPSPYNSYPLRNSKRLTRAIVSTAMSGGMMLREAASLLNVRTETVMELARTQQNGKPAYYKRSLNHDTRTNH